MPTIRFASPFPLNGERAGVRGEKVPEAHVLSTFMESGQLFWLFSGLRRHPIGPQRNFSLWRRRRPRARARFQRDRHILWVACTLLQQTPEILFHHFGLAADLP